MKTALIGAAVAAAAMTALPSAAEARTYSSFSLYVGNAALTIPTMIVAMMVITMRRPTAITTIPAMTIIRAPAGAIMTAGNAAIGGMNAVGIGNAGAIATRGTATMIDAVAH
jgi:hypothetical protein